MNFWAPWMLYLYWHELLQILPWHKKFLFLNNLLRMVLIFHPQGWVIWLFFGGFGLHEQRKVHYAKDREIIITIGCEPWCNMMEMLHENVWSHKTKNFQAKVFFTNYLYWQQMDLLLKVVGGYNLNLCCTRVNMRLLIACLKFL